MVNLFLVHIFIISWFLFTAICLIHCQKSCQIVSLFLACCLGLLSHECNMLIQTFVFVLQINLAISYPMDISFQITNKANGLITGLCYRLKCNHSRISRIEFDIYLLFDSFSYLKLYQTLILNSFDYNPYRKLHIPLRFIHLRIHPSVSKYFVMYQNIRRNKTSMTHLKIVLYDTLHHGLVWLLLSHI